MPYRDQRSAAIARSGFGKPGYCRACSFVGELELNERLKSPEQGGLGWSVPKIQEWLATHYDGVKIDRKVLYNHKNEHLGHPQDRFVTAVEETKKREAMLPPVTTNEQFLGAIRDGAMQRALLNPESVTIDQGIKAAQTLLGAKKGTGDLTITLVGIMTGVGYTPPEVIEGEFQEV